LPISEHPELPRERFIQQPTAPAASRSWSMRRHEGTRHYKGHGQRSSARFFPHPKRSTTT
jgi:hypothetical protein